MSSVLLVAHHDRAEAGALARSAATSLREQGHSVGMLPSDAAALGLDDLVDGVGPQSADLAVSLGGDGTMLRTVQLVGSGAVPILGVNVGLLGYLTEVEPDAMHSALDRFFAGPEAGAWQIDERMLLDVGLIRSNGDAGPTWTALNEGVLEKQESGHTVRLQVWIDGSPFTSYAADGLILATPTGSTAYSLSARGPVLSPRMRAVLLTPVSPHMLFDRSLVLDASERVDVDVLGHRPATLSIDGRPATSLSPGDRVTVAPSQQVARFVRFGERHFHQILKAKFGLTDR